jgi:uncharacterized protein (DUF427 family)
MFTATWNGLAIASGTDVIEVEGRIYFRRDDVRQELLIPAPDRSVCEWKGGEAEYFDLVAGGQVNRAAAWSYPELGEIARPLAGRIAFWKDVAVGWTGSEPAPQLARIEARTPNVAKALGATDVIWRPSLPARLQDRLGAENFAGYLIESQRILVDVLATPPELERAERIAEACAKADAIRDWNMNNADQAFGYIAVWGSATPDAAELAIVRQGGAVVALFAKAPHSREA